MYTCEVVTLCKPIVPSYPSLLDIDSNMSRELPSSRPASITNIHIKEKSEFRVEYKAMAQSRKEKRCALRRDGAHVTRY